MRVCSRNQLLAWAHVSSRLYWGLLDAHGEGANLTRPPTEPNLGRKQMKVVRGFWDARVKAGLTREALDTFVRALGTGTGTDGQEDGAMVCAGMEGITNTF